MPLLLQLPLCIALCIPNAGCPSEDPRSDPLDAFEAWVAQMEQHAKAANEAQDVCTAIARVVNSLKTPPPQFAQLKEIKEQTEKARMNPLRARLDHMTENAEARLKQCLRQRIDKLFVAMTSERAKIWIRGGRLRVEYGDTHSLRLSDCKGKPDLAALAEGLCAIRRAEDVRGEIRGDLLPGNAVAYQEVLAVMDTALAAGFTLTLSATDEEPPPDRQPSIKQHQRCGQKETTCPLVDPLVFLPAKTPGEKALHASPNVVISPPGICVSGKLVATSVQIDKAKNFWEWEHPQLRAQLEALRKTPGHSPELVIAVTPDTPFKLVARTIYNAGLAGLYVMNVRAAQRGPEKSDTCP